MGWLSRRISEPAESFAFPGESYTGQRGMTLRDWYAGQALVGLMLTPGALGINRRTIVDAAYATADLMLAERDRK